MARAQPWEYVFLGRSVLLDSRTYAPSGKAFFAASFAPQRRMRHGIGACYRSCNKSGLSGLGLSGSALSLSWTDLSDLFLTVDPGVFFGNAAPWLGGKVLMPTRWKSR